MINPLFFCRLSILFLAFNFLPRDARPQKGAPYSLSLKRLQLKIVSSYAHAVYQGNIDADSAIMLASESEHLNPSLYYDEAYDDGSLMPGRELIDHNDLRSAISLANSLNGLEKVKLQIQIGAWYLYKSGTVKSDMDSALLFLSAAAAGSKMDPSGKWQNRTATMLGEYYAKNGENQQAAQIFTRVLNHSKEIADQKEIAQALAFRGVFTPYQQPEKLGDLNKALAIFQEQKDTVKEIEMLTRIFEVFFFQGKIDTVEKGLVRIMDLEDAIGFRQTQYNYNVLSYIAGIEGRLSDKFSYCMKAVKIMEANGDRAFEDFFYLMAANLFGQLNDLDESIYWYNKAVDRSNPNRAKRRWYPLFLSELNTFISFNRYAEAIHLVQTTISEFPPIHKLDKMLIALDLAASYYSLNQMDSSKKYMEESIQWAGQIKTDDQARFRVADTYLWASEFYIANQQLSQSEFFLKKAKTCLPDYNLDVRMRLARIQYKMDSAYGKYETAFHSYQLYRKLDDSLDVIKKSKELSTLRIQYDIEKKDKDLELKAKNIQVLTAESRLQESRARQANTIRNVIIAGAGMLLLLLGLLYNRYMIKQRKNLQLEENQKEISAKNMALTKLLSENEWLLREVHHRVKNNLQIVMSLLNSQTRYLQDESAQKAILESQHRVQTMSLIHQKLYKSKNASSIFMPEYIRDLLEYLQDSFKTRNTIWFELDIQPIELDVMHAVPVGLILNEVITNAIKYAFPDNPDAKIVIKLLQTDTNNILLYIRDNGKGFAKGFDLDKDSSFGMILIKGLTEDLDGTISIQSNQGIIVQMEFKNVSANSIGVQTQTAR